ncbi:hypothetical protein NBRC10512_004541 [Rhodotorula toruloides]|uniref:RHTO0S14e04302g1_1 n=2 Tax=Rhodotorula toruloides TaxID=5286 RepID=A0A061BC25_RHOTO|nr:uncharacterized protein RHTO_05076 [Rhodotorula toruloides NP11]EMS24896.1 hypothetical protein RHTO_05076 [Rhodotorula toruloides NP11]CDR47497.1 RHTO0S14e04302g1_1 [Rhodotorula toruloides]
MSASVLSLPATLNATTLDYLLREAHDLYYPMPTPGFTVRIAVLLTIVASTVLLALFYLSHHLYTSYRDTHTLWFIRLIERPSGRFIVLNPRVTWSIAIIAHGSFVLVLVALFWQIYAHEYSKRTYIALKTLQPLPQFVGGWMGTWSSLQAFLVASESANSPLLPAYLANTLFLLGGFVLALPDLVLAIINSHLALRLDDRYSDLVSALQALDAQLAGKTPTVQQLLQLKEPAGKLQLAAGRLKQFSVAQYCVTIMLPIACLIVNAGGLALARKIHVHIRENVSLIALHTATTSLPPQPLDISLALVPTRTTTDTPMMVLGKVVSRGLGFGEEGEGEGKKGLMGLREVGSAERAIVSTAGAGGGGGASDWVQAQGRKVAELRKAKRDLVLVTSTIVLICTLLIADVVWLIVGLVRGGLRRGGGGWKQTELSATLDKWILFTATLCACIYLNYNALSLNRASRVPGDTGLSRRDGLEVVSLPVLRSSEEDGEALKHEGSNESSSFPDSLPHLDDPPPLPRLRPQISSTRLGTPRSSWFVLPTTRRSGPQPVAFGEVRITVETEEVADGVSLE